MKGESVITQTVGRVLRLCLWSLVIGGAFWAPAHAAVAVSQVVDSQRFEVPLAKAIYLDVGQNVEKISMADPNVAEMILLRPRQLLIHGTKLGNTNVLLWNASNQVFAVLDIEVTYDLETLKQKMYQALPGENIKVSSSNQRIVLSGQVSSLPKMDAALKLAASFVRAGQAGGGAGGVSAQAGVELNPNVINLLTVAGAQEVTLAVRVAEVNRTLIKNLDVRFRSFGTQGDFTSGLVGTGGGLAGSALANPLPLFAQAFSGGGLLFNFFDGSRLVNVTMDIAKNQNLLKILAEPNLTALSGEKASFLSGGEFPIPVSQGATGGGVGAISVEFKEFGVGVEFVPVVLDQKRINLKTNVSVSDLSADAPIVLGVPGTEGQFFIPSLNTRRAATAVELSDGQTLSIAGLINDRTRQASRRFPWLGDVPVLGALFRSQNFQNDQTELVIFVTPHLARPVPKDQIKLPVDNFIEPDDVEFYLMGRTEGTVRRGTSLTRFMESLGTGSKGGLEGPVGLQLEEDPEDEED